MLIHMRHVWQWKHLRTWVESEWHKVVEDYKHEQQRMRTEAQLMRNIWVRRAAKVRARPRVRCFCAISVHVRWGA
jgi:hypothetical protein